MFLFFGGFVFCCLFVFHSKVNKVMPAQSIHFSLNCYKEKCRQKYKLTVNVKYRRVSFQINRVIKQDKYCYSEALKKISI